MSAASANPSQWELEEAKEQASAARHAAKLLPPGTRICLPSGTVSEVRALAHAMGKEVYLAYYSEGGDEPGPYVIERVRERLERGVTVESQCARRAEAGDEERAEVCRRRYVEILAAEAS